MSTPPTHKSKESDTTSYKDRTKTNEGKIKPDVERYLPYLDDLDLTLTEKTDLIHTLWVILESFVDVAFDEISVVQPRHSGSKGGGNPVYSGDSDHSLALAFSKMSELSGCDGGEGSNT